MSDSAWQPGASQDAPKEVKKAKKKSAKKVEKKAAGENKNGLIAGEQVSFADIQRIMKNQSQPVIERSPRRKRK